MGGAPRIHPKATDAWPQQNRQLSCLKGLWMQAAIGLLWISAGSIAYALIHPERCSVSISLALLKVNGNASSLKLENAS